MFHEHFSRLTKQASPHGKITLWSYKMTHESFRPWAHGSPSPAWIIHFDSVTFGLIGGAISHLEESEEVWWRVFFLFPPVFICHLRRSSEERVLQNGNTLGVNENAGNPFWSGIWHFIYLFVHLLGAQDFIEITQVLCAHFPIVFMQFAVLMCPANPTSF